MQNQTNLKESVISSGPARPPPPGNRTVVATLRRRRGCLGPQAKGICALSPPPARQWPGSTPVGRGGARRSLQTPVGQCPAPPAQVTHPCHRGGPKQTQGPLETPTGCCACHESTHSTPVHPGFAKPKRACFRVDSLSDCGFAGVPGRPISLCLRPNVGRRPPVSDPPRVRRRRDMRTTPSTLKRPGS